MKASYSSANNNISWNCLVMQYSTLLILTQEWLKYFVQFHSVVEIREICCLLELFVPVSQLYEDHKTSSMVAEVTKTLFQCKRLRI